jgi:serine/threonine-protein kinase
MRFETACEFADAIEEAAPLATRRKVGEWVERLCGLHLTKRSERVSEIERSTTDLGSPKDLQKLLAAKATAVPWDAVALTDSTLPSAVANPLHANTQSTASSALEFRLLVSEPPKKRRRWTHRRWLLPVVASALALLVVVAVTRLERQTEPSAIRDEKSVQNSPAANPQPMRESEAPALPIAVPARPAATHDSPGRSDDLVPPTASGSASNQAKRAAGARDHRRSAKAAAAKVAKANRPAQKKDCNPPYFIDDQGIRRVKPQCR